MSTGAGTDGRISLLTALVDDAALFPPARLDMAGALAGHARHRGSPHAWMVGRFVCPASRLPELRVTLPEDQTLDVSVVLDGLDAGSFPDGLERDLEGIGAADDVGGVAVSALEVRLPDGDPVEHMVTLVRVVTGAGLVDRVRILAEVPIAGRSPEEVGTAVAAMAAAQRRLTDLGRSAIRKMRGAPATPGQEESLPSYVTRTAHPVPEPMGVPPVHPADPGRLLGAKVRCGGEEPGMVPSVGELTAFVVACHRAHVPWKATAGLHHPVRHEREDGATEHGFLNLAAMAALLHEGQTGPAALAEILDERAAVALDASGLRVRDRVITPALLAAARRNCLLSIGSCSIDEPVEDLAALGVLTAEGALA